MERKQKKELLEYCIRCFNYYMSEKTGTYNSKKDRAREFAKKLDYELECPDDAFPQGNECFACIRNQIILLSEITGNIQKRIIEDFIARGEERLKQAIFNCSIDGRIKVGDDGAIEGIPDPVKAVTEKLYEISE